MRRGLIPAALFAGGMIVLGLAVRRPGSGWAAIVGGLAAGGGLAWALAAERRPLGLLGIRPIARRHVVWLILCAALGVGLALWYRFAQGRAILPGGWRVFALAAAGIGLAEEVGYRGLVQGCLRGRGPVVASLVASLLHTAYKCSLLAPRPGEPATDLLWLGVGTLVVGAIFGLMRESAGGLAMPAAAHAAFDIWAYGDSGAVPWWV